MYRIKSRTLYSVLPKPQTYCACQEPRSMGTFESVGGSFILRDLAICSGEGFAFQLSSNTSRALQHVGLDILSHHLPPCREP